MNEFEIIQRYLTNKISERADVVKGIGDDAAILQVPSAQNVVMTLDCLVENIHFFPSMLPADLGYKSLAISLSDIAAMGAEPAWALLGLNLPKADEKWLEMFCEGFFNLCKRFNLNLIGGNISRGQLAITTQLTGFLPSGKGLLRSGAKPGDLIYVTGTLGDAGLALELLQKKKTIPEPFYSDILQRFYRPEPRVEEGMVLRELATAAIDISDGLISDLSHLLQASQVGATVNTHRLPLSKTLRTQIKPDHAWRLALTAGEDYELCFTIPLELRDHFELRFGHFDCGYICIGKIEEQSGLRIVNEDGSEFKINQTGFKHFV